MKFFISTFLKVFLEESRKMTTRKEEIRHENRLEDNAMQMNTRQKKTCIHRKKKKL